MNQPPPVDRFAKAKNIARISLKRFGPLLFTGLAAVAEHHWLKHDDDPEPLQQPKDDTSLQELKHEVKKLRKKIKRGKRKSEDDSSSSSSNSTTDCARQRIVESPVRGRRRPIGEEQTRAREAYYNGFETWGPPPPPLAPEPPQQYQRYQTFQPPQLPRETTMIGQRDIQPPLRLPRHISHHRPRRHRRHHSVPSIISSDFSPEAVHAGKVAAVAGMIEALHVGEFRGDWIGRKGARVGTTMAASFGASYARDEDPRDMRRRDVVLDVGKGLVVSRLVHGRAERVEDGYRGRRRGRRWSSSF
jgi:hypothetical protein